MKRKLVYLPSVYSKDIVDNINSYFDKGYNIEGVLDAAAGFYLVLILNNNEEYKSILILKYDMELSYKEIALLLGTNEDVIKTYMYRARNKFKEEWRMINE